MKLATASQMKELDRQAIEEYGVSSLGLMERAALAVAEEVRGLLEGGGPDFIGGADSVKVLGAGAETEEDRRELEALQALAEEKNQNHAPWVGVLCGPGNNGGDGYALACLLAAALPDHVVDAVPIPPPTPRTESTAVPPPPSDPASDPDVKSGFSESGKHTRRLNPSSR